MAVQHRSLSEILGAWRQPESDSGLIERVHNAWTKPIGTLTNREIATCLRQSIAVEHLLPIAKERVQQRIDDGSELDDEELARAIEDTGYRELRDAEHKRMIAERFRTNEKSG